LPLFKTGSKEREKKAAEHISNAYLQEALADFCGYIAVDEVYDGPFCVLSLVDNRRFRRLMYEVLDHSPDHGDMQRFLQRFKAALDARGLTLRGITTDGSALYPVPITAVFGPVPHQICEFHVLKEINAAILHAVAKVRKALASQLPKLGRGRPSGAGKRLARRRQRLHARIAALFEHRYLFVQRRLTLAEQQTLRRLVRGQPQLRSLRAIANEIYGLFDRRCRMETALTKLVRLRRRVRRFTQLTQTLTKLLSPTLEKALVFLDDASLPPTSNAVERGNRRYRKMQKAVYKVRTQEQVVGRVALDMQRDAHAGSRYQTTVTLHHARAA
jgi:hypothetical protein